MSEKESIIKQLISRVGSTRYTEGDLIMTNKWLKVALMAAAIATGTSIKIDAETVLYVPQDDRPVSLQYTVDTAREAGMTILTPPQNLISGKNYQGQADQIMAWVEQNAGRADVMVLSTDTLIYGGLVDSRKHNIPLSTLESRLKRIESLKARNKKYVFMVRYCNALPTC